MAQTNTGVPTPLAARAAGVSLRQVGYWAKTGLVVPSLRDTTGRGVHRRYDLRDVMALRVVGDLRREHVSLQACRKVQQFLGDEGIPSFASARLVVFPGARADVVFAKNERECISILEARGQVVAAAIVPLGKLKREVQRGIRRAREQERLEKQERKRGKRSAA